MTAIICFTVSICHAQNKSLEERVQYLEKEMASRIMMGYKGYYQPIKKFISDSICPKQEPKTKRTRSDIEFSITNVTSANNKIVVSFKVLNKSFDKTIRMSDAYLVDGNQQVHYLEHPGVFKNTESYSAKLPSNTTIDYSITFDIVEPTTLIKGFRLSFYEDDKSYEMVFKDIDIIG